MESMITGWKLRKTRLHADASGNLLEHTFSVDRAAVKNGYCANGHSMIYMKVPTQMLARQESLQLQHQQAQEDR
jgi:hypothetical protein